ncbi:MAG: 23S rRNA (adenine(2503)-C(2))-methyltransferase RlmN [Firmicutes bacterium HGW-Firmicutes-8]|nr:MAG: 23S rRNA (adenine(2503)-C(2))-methyltransferase RlmN [Firmicutes bacterium HGW-Firmicutes-8]
MDFTAQETEQFLISLGEPAYRGRQIHKWVHQKGITRFADMTNLPLKLRDKLQTASTPGGLALDTKKTSGDGTVKYLFGLSDGQAVESVFLPHEYGNSACVSSQVGCRMGCRFCASTIGGFVRDLTAGEMYAQIIGIRDDTGARISSVVIMGSGEPADNLTQVLKFISLIISPDGLNIGSRHITVSTCGVVPGIKRLAVEKPQVTLSVSLHAPNDEVRDEIMPINRKYPLGVLIEACREYISITNRRVTFEYALIDGFNDSREQAGELGRLLRGMLCHVNLIPLNEVAERGFRRSNRAAVKSFKDVLEEMGVPVTIRQEMGAEIDAACGQLRRRVLREQDRSERR